MAATAKPPSSQSRQSRPLPPDRPITCGRSAGPGPCRQAKGDTELAVRLAQSAIVADPARPAILCRAGRYLCRRPASRDIARSYYDEALGIDPADAAAPEGHGRAGPRHRPRPPTAADDRHSMSVLVLDFGSQVTQLIARRVREAGVYCEIVPYNKADEALAQEAARHHPVRRPGQRHRRATRRARRKRCSSWACRCWASAMAR